MRTVQRQVMRVIRDTRNTVYEAIGMHYVKAEGCADCGKFLATGKAGCPYIAPEGTQWK